MGAWPVELTDEFEAWWSSEEVSEDDQEAITAAVELLQERGPALGRPLVDGVKSSRHPNMKELRPQRNDIRIFFAFDPRRAAPPFSSSVEARLTSGPASTSGAFPSLTHCMTSTSPNCEQKG
jgi:hypothetical protein